VRENTFISTGGGHTTGKDSFVDSFTEVLKEKKIKDCTTTIISDEERASSLLNKELILAAKNEGESVDEQVDRLADMYNTEYFLDRESAHFSYGKELHGMYGAENNYKFYFYFPVEYILQNDFYHSTRLGPEAQIGSGYINNDRGIQQTRNDFEIFNFGEGVPINAGILCITKGVPVDPKTGSQYVLQNGIPVKDGEGNFVTPEHTINSEDYWEKYFTDHPEQKPSKVIYGGMYTRANTESEDMVVWARSKEIHTQDEEKKKEFIEYRDSKKEEIRAMFKKVITKIYEEHND
jgi:hypothetical protein